MISSSLFSANASLPIDTRLLPLKIILLSLFPLIIADEISSIPAGTTRPVNSFLKKAAGPTYSMLSGRTNSPPQPLNANAVLPIYTYPSGIFSVFKRLVPNDPAKALSSTASTFFPLVSILGNTKSLLVLTFSLPLSENPATLFNSTGTFFPFSSLLSLSVLYIKSSACHFSSSCCGSLGSTI